MIIHRFNLDSRQGIARVNFLNSISTSQQLPSESQHAEFTHHQALGILNTLSWDQDGDSDVICEVADFFILALGMHNIILGLKIFLQDHVIMAHSVLLT